MGGMKDAKQQERTRKTTKASKWAYTYPGQGWADNNLTDAAKSQWAEDVNGDHWDTNEVLCAAWTSGYQITCKYDRGDKGVFMAVMTSVDPGRPDYGVWLSMRGSNAQDALDRVLWVWSVQFEGMLRAKADAPKGDIW